MRIGGIEVLAPATVVDEIEAGAEHDSTIEVIRQTGWLSVVPCPVLPDAVRNCKLDAGDGKTQDLNSGKWYAVYGKECDIPGCNYDAWVEEILAPPKAEGGQPAEENH